MSLQPRAWIAQVGRDLTAGEYKVLTDATEAVAKNVARNVPVRSGRLKRSIRVIPPVAVRSQGKSVVRAGVTLTRYYGRFVEHGTSRQRGRKFLERSGRQAVSAMRRGLEQAVEKSMNRSIRMNGK